MSQSYTFICHHCQSAVTLEVGISGSYRALSKQLKERALKGRYGTACQQALSLPGGVIDARRFFYMCDQGHFMTSLSKDVYQSYLKEDIPYAFYFSPRHYKRIQPFTHVCPLCHDVMQPQEMPAHLTCPHCHHEMVCVESSFAL